MKEDKKLLSIYFTAGYPSLNDTVGVIKQLEASGVDMIEIGLPFSDPLADGPTIQESSTAALKNGMTTKKLFEQLAGIRETVSIPLIIMIDGLIIPDLPVAEYDEHYRAIFEKYGLKNIFLITPQTSEERIRFIDSVSDGFIYMVSSASVTGSTSGFGNAQEDYFNRIAGMNLKNPQIVGFGIKDAETFSQTTKTAKGAIIGSAFIKMITRNGVSGIDAFIKSIR